MNELILYLLKVVLIQGIFFLVYWLFFRKTARHAANRAFLLLALALSFIIPFFELPTFGSEISEGLPIDPMVTWFSSSTLEAEYSIEPVRQGKDYSFQSLTPWIYLCIALMLMVRSIIYLITLQKLKKQSEPIPKKGFTLFKTTQSRPFSFLRNVFIPRSLFGSDAFKQVLAHECVHVSRYHSVDRLFLDFIVSLFWINPFIYCYRNALIEIHEYEADEGVLRTYTDPVTYQEILFSQLKSTDYSGLVSHFNFQIIKKRIVMMNKQKKRTGWIYGLTLPVTLVVIFAFSSREAMHPIKEMGREITSFIGPVDDLPHFALPLQQDTFRPSILPLREAEVGRMTSGFGMRMHPIEKRHKMHTGMDFSCRVGSEVIATADGEVLELRNKPEGYGKLIVLGHGDEFKTYYGQLSQFKVKQGDIVKRGQVIGLSGNSGMSTAPHLHYEVLKDNKRVDPAGYIKNYTFSKKVVQPSSTQSEAASEDSRNQAKQLEKEHELARREAELEAREKELLAARQQLAQEEMERAQEQRLKAQDLVKEALLMELEASEQEAQQQATEEERALSIKVKGSKGGNPLYVLDGEIVETSVGANIDQEAIESITVIKGESAREKYGSQGENGVIEIKSKSPKNKVKNKDKKKTKNKSKK